MISLKSKPMDAQLMRIFYRKYYFTNWADKIQIDYFILSYGSTSSDGSCGWSVASETRDPRFIPNQLNGHSNYGTKNFIALTFKSDHLKITSFEFGKSYS